MKAYTYNSTECGMNGWPSGTLRLEGMEPAAPENADVFIYPGPLSLATTYGLTRLPYFNGNEARHCFLDVSDHFTEPIGKPCMFIRCNMRTWMRDDDPHSIPFAWPVEDYAECMPVPDGGFKYDVSFHGWLSTAAREQSSQSCLDNPNLKCDMARYADFTGYIYHEPEGLRRRAEFRRSMRESRLALCPESIPGVMPYRFYEAMSAGRVPVLVASDYVLPFEDEIPYDDFIVRIERDQAYAAGGIIANWLSGTPDQELIEMGEQARKWWAARLDCRKWPELMSYAVQRQMRAMGLTEETPVLCG